MILVAFFPDIQNSDLMAPPFVRPLDSGKGINWQKTHFYSLLSLFVNLPSADSIKNQRQAGHFYLVPFNRKQYNRHRDKLKVLA